MSKMHSKSLTTLALVRAATAAGPVRSSIPTYIDGNQYNKPYGGPPGEWFAGDSSLPIDRIASAVRELQQASGDSTYIISNDNYQTATIHSDWAYIGKVYKDT